MFETLQFPLLLPSSKIKEFIALFILKNTLIYGPAL